MPLPEDFNEGDPGHIAAHEETNTVVNVVEADLAAHEAAGDPHAQYETSAEAAAKVTAHEAAGDPHPTYETSTEAAAKVTAHEAASDPHTGYQKESEKGNANGYASLDGSGLVPDAQIPGGIARDSEVTSAISTHEGAGNPHPTYLTEAEADALYVELDQTEWVDLTDGGATTLHSHAGGGHPDLATHDALGLATDTELANHTGDTSDAHDASAISIADAGNDFTATDVEGALDELQADNEAHVAAADPHAGYRLESAAIVTADIQDAAVTYAKIQDVSATDRLLGRDSAGAGDIEEIAPSAARTMLDVPSNTTFNDHSARHENGGADEITIAGLDGTPVELQNHLDDTTDAHDASAVSVDSTNLSGTATQVQGSLEELDNLLDDHSSRHDAGGADAMTIDAAAGTGSLRTLGTGSAQAAAGNHSHASVAFSVGGVLLDPTGARFVMIWRAPFACTVTNVRGHRKGGTGATVNARRNQTSDFLASDLSLGTADQWADGGSVQNTSISAGDDIEIELASITGSVTEIAIQVDLTRSV